MELLKNKYIGNFALKSMKSKAANFLHCPMDEAMEKQDKMLEEKFERMERAAIGKKFGINKNSKLEGISLTNYEFYKPFYDSPQTDGLMYDRKDYATIETSGTSGARKRFLFPKHAITRSLRETGMSLLMLMFHNGEKITLEYGDLIFVNTGAGPFAGGVFTALGSKEMGIVKFVPNINLSYMDKVDYFIKNYEKIDGAVIYASTLLSQVMPKIQKAIQLKALITMDSVVADANKETIREFTGVYPKSPYGSTETLMCSITSSQYPLGNIFDWRRGIFEFIPKKSGKSVLLKMDEVRVGEIYQPVFTSFHTEITRYVLNDFLLVVSKKDDLLGADWPVFKYNSRAEKTISIQNFTRISEGEILQVLDDLYVPYVEFAARLEIVNSLEFMVLYMEFSKTVSLEEVAVRIHDKLCEIDSDYKCLSSFFGYRPIMIRKVPTGTFAKFLDWKGGSLPKVDRINMCDEDFSKLSAMLGEDTLMGQS